MRFPLPKIRGGMQKHSGHAQKLKSKAKRAITIDAIKWRYVKRLNNLHVGTQITVAALGLKLDQIASEGHKNQLYHFRVPSSGGQPTARIKRDEQGMRELLQSMIEGGEYAKALLSAVSITEDFVANMLSPPYS